MHELKKVVQNLEEDEAKTMLFLLLLRISMLEETNYSVEEFTKDLLQTYKDILRISTKQNKTITDYTATHIVFGDSASGSLKMALRDMGYTKLSVVNQILIMYHEVQVNFPLRN